MKETWFDKVIIKNPEVSIKLFYLDCCVPTTLPSLCPECKSPGTCLRVLLKHSARILVTLNGKTVLTQVTQSVLIS